MSVASRSVVWSREDPFLVGPYAAPADGTERAFDVPCDPDPRLQIGRLIAGPRWPDGVSPVDGPVAVPIVRRDRLSGECAEKDVVAHVEVSGFATVPLCAIESSGRSRWNTDPAGWLHAVLTERYVDRWRRPLPSRVPFLNYSRVPNAIKRALTPRARLDLARSNAIAFPAVPFDDFVEVVRELCASLAAGRPARRRAVWPDGRLAAATLTHDVDTRWILEPARNPLLAEILAEESRLGYRGAWYVTANQFQPRRHARAIDLIAAAGHEVGVHGWNHDAKLEYLGERRRNRRLSRARARLSVTGATGIRTPWYCRSESLYRDIAAHFEYSTSMPNASAFFTATSNSGCCSVLPFRPVGDLVEMPMTLPPDTAGEIDDVYRALESLSGRIVSRAGVVVVTLHPQPHQSANPAGLRAYFDFLGRLHDHHGESLWHATPRDIVARYREVLLAGRSTAVTR